MHSSVSLRRAAAPFVVLAIAACSADGHDVTPHDEAMAASSGALAGTDLYASPTGAGSLCLPRAPCSLAGAQQRVRALNGNMTADIRVNLLDGVYELASPFTLTESATQHDSGTNGYNVVYQAAAGARPILSGGRSLTGWQLSDAAHGIYRAPAPPGLQTRQLYVNGVRATRARGASSPPHLAAGPNGWITSDPSVASYRNVTDVEAVGSHHWRMLRCPVASTAVLPWHNDVALSDGTKLNVTNDWLTNAGQGVPYRLGDFNGDRKTDILFAYGDGSGWHNYVALSSGSSFYFSGDWLFNAGQGVPYQFGDFNGDRRTDILFAYADGSGGWHNDLALSSGSSFQFSGPWLPSGAGQGTTYEIGDFNGDRRSDVLFASPPATAINLQQPCWSSSQLAGGWESSDVWWLENAYELLDEPGDWYLDRPNGYVYYIPRAGENLATANVVAPVLQMLVTGSGTGGGTPSPTFLHDVQLKGLTFAFATWLDPSSSNGNAEAQAGWHYVGQPATAVATPANVTFSTVKNLDIENDVFTHLGAAGLTLDTASQGNTVVGNVFTDVSSTAIQIGDVDFPTPAPGQTISTLPIAQRTYANLVKDNWIHAVAAEYQGAVGIFFGHSDHGTIVHNEVADLPYTGVSVGWGWSSYAYPTGSYANGNRIENNSIHDVMQRLSDGGGIYTLSFQPGSDLIGNYIANVGGIGIYHDEGTRFYSDSGNVVSGAQLWLQLWINTILNNTLVSNYADYDHAFCNGSFGASEAVCNFGDGDPSTRNHVSGNTFTNGGPWPAAAQAIIGAAGLEAAYAGIKAPVCGDATCNGTETAVTCRKDCGR